MLLGTAPAIPPALASLLLVGGMAALLLGGHWLVEGSVAIARRLGISTLVIGLTIVAFGTSSPELFVNVNAALTDHGALSFGNVVGSNIANIALVLGASAVVCPLLVHGHVVRTELPQLIAVTAGCLLLAWLPATRLVAEPGAPAIMAFTRWDGLVMIAAFALLSITWLRLGLRDRSDPLDTEAATFAEKGAGPGLLKATVLCLAGLALLVAGGEGTTRGAVSIAMRLGVSEALIGLTIVAIGTSLPELITSIMAARRGYGDLAVGNIVGSNLFNLLLVLGITSTIAPVPVPAGTGVTDLVVMLVVTVVLLPMTMTHHRRVVRREGLLLLLCYVGYMTWSVVREV